MVRSKTRLNKYAKFVPNIRRLRKSTLLARMRYRCIRLLDWFREEYLPIQVPMRREYVRRNQIDLHASPFARLSQLVPK